MSQKKETDLNGNPNLIPREKWFGIIRHCEDGLERQARSKVPGAFVDNVAPVLKAHIYDLGVSRLVEACGGDAGLNDWFIQVYPKAWQMICEHPQTRDEVRFSQRFRQVPLELVQERVRRHFQRGDR